MRPDPGQPDREHLSTAAETRRRFISLLACSLVGACLPSKGGGSRGPGKPAYCLEPADHAKRTLEALIDTAIPGSQDDPSGAPGGVEACVLSTFYDPFFSLEYAVPVVVGDVDSAAKRMFGRPFADLGLAERTQVVLEREGQDVQAAGFSVYSLVFAFFRLAFYSGVLTDVGPELAGFPGPNLGYRGRSSHGLDLAKEMTEDGSLP
ncbi:MAG: hypothetical protein HYY13_06310 [Nitrospirae bacterium]|nr:hypothetical protein [Nitrospirota bacterium]